jgi:hypothetical protein
LDQQWTRVPISVRVTVRRGAPLGRFRDVFRQHLMDVTHGTGWHAYERTIDAQISRLSKKEDRD